MLEYFKVKNFKSIVEETFYFTYNEKKAPSKKYLEENEEIIFLNSNGKNNDTKNKNRFSPVNGFWGANASGKSNIIKAFSYFQTFFFDYNKGIVLGGILYLGSSFKNLKTLYQPNKLHPELENNTTFEISIILDNDKYQYFIEYNNESILKEELKVNNNLIYSINNSIIELNFIKDNEKNPYLNKNNIKQFFNSYCLENQNQIYIFLKKIISEIPNINDNLKKFYNFIKNNIIISSSNDCVDGKDYNKNIEEIKNNISQITEYLKKFDIDISKIEYKEEGKKYYSYHKNISGEEIKFNFMKEESDGTKILLYLFDDIIDCLNNGKILIIDELDKSLHSLAIIILVKMFKRKCYNKNNAQLIFTCHNTDLLDNFNLRRTEINLVDKTREEGTKSYRLSNSKNIRNVNDFRRQYLKGLLGGTPIIEML